MAEGQNVASGAIESSGGGSAVAGRRVGRYELLRQIGRGGMATVYLARQDTLNREVALKELSSFHASSPDMAQRFLRESRLAGSLNHPNIVTVIEYFEHGGIPYIAMEYVRRGSLRQYMGRLSFAQFVGVMEGVLAGLAHAETEGIVHRDLKPENLMVTVEGRVKITDFGIAKATQSVGTGMFLTSSGTTVGTPTYMAPEQAMGRDIGSWTDLYSLGIMAWENMVGHTPFHDSDVPLVILTRHLNEEIPSVRQLRPDVDPLLSDWIDRLLVKRATDRAQSPIAVWEELEEIVIERLGPRWRREARLPSPSEVLDTPKPLTPAPFESQRVRTPEPGRASQQLGTPAVEAEPGSGYVTFGRKAEETPPPTPAPPPVSPEPEAGIPDTIEPSEPAAPEPEPEPEPEQEPRQHPPAPEDDGGWEPTLPPKRLREETPEPALREETAEPALEPEGEPAASTPVPAAATERRRRPSPRVLSGIVAAGVLAAVVGFLIAPSSGSTPRSAPALLASASNGPINVSFPATWRRASSAAAPDLKLTNTISLDPGRGSGGVLLLGTAAATGPSLLPTSLTASLPAKPTAQVVKLGRNQFYRYLALTPKGASAPESVYTLPTTGGTVIAVCMLGGAGGTFPAECERVIGTLQLTGASALALGPSASFGAEMSGVLNELNSKVSTATTRLAKAGKPGDQASAANALAAAYEQAAGAIAKLHPAPAIASATSSLRDALRATGRDYRSLAAAASHNDRRGYGNARSAVEKDANAVSGALAGFADAGYAVS